MIARNWSKTMSKKKPELLDLLRQLPNSDLKKVRRKMQGMIDKRKYLERKEDNSND